MPDEIDDLRVDSLPANAERDFDAWVRRRLADWTSSEIREFERWLVDESRSEFVPAVRAAWKQRLLAELRVGSAEPAA